MPHPIVCQDERLRQHLQYFRPLFSSPQFQHFVTVLMALVLGEGGHTLSHLRRAVAGKKSLSSLSRFFAKAPWDHRLVIQYNFSRFYREIQPNIDEERQSAHRELKKQKRRGKCPVPPVTGYLIGDDSTMYKPRGVKMQGIGRHHSTTYKKRVTGHSLVQCIYTVLGHSCPLEPLLYRQRKTAEAEGVKFLSKVDLMIQQIKDFIPPPGTATHILLDSWYTCKKLWKAVREHKYNITTGIKRNRLLRVACDVTPETPQGWKWQKLDDYATSLPDSAYQECICPRNPKKKAYVHIVDTHVKKLYRCQVIIVREDLNDPVASARYWVTSDRGADAQTCLNVISIRWDIEVFFEDTKELFGIDQYQIMTSDGLLRYWTLCWIAFSFLEKLRHDLQHHKDCQSQISDQAEKAHLNAEKLDESHLFLHHLSLGQAQRHVQEIHQQLFLQWVYQHAFSGTPVHKLHALLTA
jgi:SRSO17 transposase